jgi:hypothetical protein
VTLAFDFCLPEVAEEKNESLIDYTPLLTKEGI